MNNQILEPAMRATALLLLLACHGSDPAQPQSQPSDLDPTEEDSGVVDDTGANVVHIEETPGCELLGGPHCLLPFPTDRFYVNDPTSGTGLRLDYPADSIPLPDSAVGPFDIAPYNRLDGASPNTQILATFGGPVDLSTAAFWDSIDRSLAADSPTMLVDLETGERLPHWVELDQDADADDDTMVYLRSTERLKEDHRYAVVYRNLRAADGSLIEPSPATLALRDGTPTDSATLEARRPGFEAMYGVLDEIGVNRSEVTLAFWFHTASYESITHDMLAIRADALSRLGEGGIGCTVTEINDNYGEGGEVTSYRRVKGTYTVPSYMESPTPPSRMARDSEGEPAYNGDVEVPFVAVIPRSVALAEGGAALAPVITFGHGLMGTGEAYLNEAAMRLTMEEYGVIMIATNWAGMSAEDVGAVGGALLNPSDFVNVLERLQQGMVNQIALTRTFSGVCAAHPSLLVDGVQVIDPARQYFVGGSEGGIYGGVLMGLSPDIEKGGLLVGGSVFPFMMERSTQFVPYLPLFESTMPRRLDRTLLLSMAQHLWDATDPLTYLAAADEGRGDLLPKKVLSVAVVNDAQVTNLSTDLVIRTMDAPLLAGSDRVPWGVTITEEPVDGSAAIFLDLGDRAPPAGNIPPDFDDGGHNASARDPIALQLLTTFLAPGGLATPP